MTNFDTPPALLLAEKDTTLQSNLERLFVRSGWSYKTVASAEQGLAILKEHTFDVVISDLCLPTQPLLDFVKGVKSINSEQALIVLAGECSAHEAVELFRKGASDFLQKPCDIDALEKAIQRLVAAHRKQERTERWFKFITAEKARYEFDAATFAANRMPLWITDQLYANGLIDLNTKLKLQLVFDEAVTNSNEHGNLELQSVWKEEFNSDGLDRYSQTKKLRLQDPAYATRKLWIDLEYDGRGLSIRIKDQGKGFLDQEQITYRPDRGAQMHGRGLGIIQSLMDEVTYSERGTVITMIKKFA